jgi:predicted esterase
MIVRLVLAALYVTVPAIVLAQTCPPSVTPNVELVPVFRDRIGLLTAKGDLAEFNPCHPSVRLDLPTGLGRKPPLVILVHGGGGIGDTYGYKKIFKGMGLATLVFDAYQMNIPEQAKIPQFTATKMTNESRQRMIFRVALGAYKWALTSSEIDTNRIYLLGVSNGASVVANLAAVTTPDHVRGVFAEGMPGVGIGLPDNLQVPLTLIYGRKDNYGGVTETSWMYERTNICAGNSTLPELPVGTSKNCNGDFTREASAAEQASFVNFGSALGRFLREVGSKKEPSERLRLAEEFISHVYSQKAGMFFKQTESPMAWLERQKSKGAPIDIWWFENSGHGFMRDLAVETKSFGNREPNNQWVGSDAVDRERYIEMLGKAIQR